MSLGADPEVALIGAANGRQSGQTELVELIVDNYNIDPRIFGDKRAYISALTGAIMMSGNPDTVEFLLDRGEIPSYELNGHLSDAVLSGNLAIVKYFVERVDPDTVNYQRLLEIATKRGHYSKDVLVFLLEKALNVGIEIYFYMLLYYALRPEVEELINFYR